jgi:hypothetical protein
MESYMNKHTQKKHNFFNKASVSTTSFADCAVSWDFISAGFMLLNESSTAADIIEYSFDGGETVHGDLSPSLPSAGLGFDNRHENAIYFRRKTAGVAVSVRIEAWA